MKDETENTRAEQRDGDLLRQYVQSRSEQAFATLGQRYAGLVYATCLREIGDRTLAEDAAQEVFVLLYRKAGALQRSDSIAGWLYAASRYVCKNRMKQERRRLMNEAHAAQSAAIEEDAGDASWERVEPHLHAALDRLKATDREAVLLRFVGEQSFAQVGSRLGLSENTARMRVSRAVEKIRAHLGTAGVAVSAILLTTILEERAAQAAPARLLQALPLIAVGQGAASVSSGPIPRLRLPRSGASSLRWLIGTGVACVALISVFAYRRALPQPVSGAEQRRLFASLAGSWRGTLEYADDRTLQHFTYSTLVTFRALNQGQVLEYSAAYAGTTSVDVTTIRVDATGGKTTIQNGGPQGSHQLNANGALLRLPTGGYVFEGENIALNADTRLQITPSPRRLTIQEEYRKSGQSRWQFRNRFTLSKP